MRSLLVKVAWISALVAVTAILLVSFQAGLAQYLVLAVAGVMCLVFVLHLTGLMKARADSQSKLPLGKLVIALLLVVVIASLGLLVVRAVEHRNLIGGAAAALFIAVLVRALNELFDGNRKTKGRDES